MNAPNLHITMELWDLCIQNRLECSEKWSEHTPESVEVNEDVKILWDLTIQTDNDLSIIVLILSSSIRGRGCVKL